MFVKTIHRFQLKKSPLFVALFCCVALAAYAQPTTYTLANAHSHNDYEQKRPFYAAYELGFGSIEADVFLQNGELYVAHNLKDISPERTLKVLYLEPLLKAIREHNGWPYPNRQPLQWLIDIKTAGPATLTALHKALAPHQKELQHVRIVISGNMPEPDQMASQDKIFTFDGRKNLFYPKEASPMIKLVSNSITDFGGSWNGKEPMSDPMRENIKTFIELQHAQKKLVRIWGTPNSELGYQTLKELGVDYIGTDDLAGLAAFLRK